MLQFARDCKQRHFYCLEDSRDQTAEVEFTDSVSQVYRGSGSSTSKTSSADRLIELEYKRSALRAARNLELAEAKHRFNIEEVKLEPEVKLHELSECGSSVSSKSALKRVRSIKGWIKGSTIGTVPHISFSVNRGNREFYESRVAALDVRPEALIPFSSKNWEYKETNQT